MKPLQPQPGDEVNQLWCAGLYQLLCQTLKKGSNLKILDIGYDKSETLDLLKDKLPNHKLQNALLSGEPLGTGKLPFKERTFDYVFLIDVMERTGDGVFVLSEAKKVIKRGGKVIIVSSGFTGDRPSRAKVRNAAKKSRLKIKRISYFNLFLRNSGNSNKVSKLQRLIFINGIKLMKYLNYPFGISIFALLEKP